MKKVIAFLVALVLLGGTIFGMHTSAGKQLNFNNPAFGYWTNNQKFQSPVAIRANLNKDSLVVLGSSELEHGMSTPYHPQNIFKGNTFQPMLIGSSYYQSLSHAITLAALEPAMEKRKVALIVSPQWFRKKGVEAGAFASRFSESAFIDMLQNEKLSKETKSHIADRAVSLLQVDKPVQKRVKNYNNILLANKGNVFTRTKYSFYKAFLDDRQKQGILVTASADGISHGTPGPLVSAVPNWDTYRTQSVSDAEKVTNNNDFKIYNKYFNRILKPHLSKRKDSSKTSSYSKSPEYEDLKCFLDVCTELGIQPMLILPPVNGKWYDYTGFPKQRRDKFYNNVKEIAGNYPNALVTDFSNDDYTDYFMEDSIHIGWKGWVSIDEVLYKFDS